jgi:hypothetical protein
MLRMVYIVYCWIHGCVSFFVRCHLAFSKEWSFYAWTRLDPTGSLFLLNYSFRCTDEFSCGNTRVAIGKGKDKEAVKNEEANFDESMIQDSILAVYIPPQALLPCLKFVVQNIKLGMRNWDTSLSWRWIRH